MSRILFAAVVFSLMFPPNTFAHKFWMLPSQTVISSTDDWVTVDAAVSNDLFYFNHFPLQINTLQITAPDGSTVQAQNAATLKYRSVFDFQVQQQGTYNVSILFDGLFGSWEQDGQRRRWRGSAESFQAEVPKDAKNLHVTQSISRVQTFVTNGAPTEQAIQSTGKGLELVPITHPNDLYAGEECRFQFLVDGKPQAGLELEIVKGSTRYRNSLEEIKVVTDEKGIATFNWKQAGMYWLETSHTDDKTTVEQASSRRLTYVATLEVLPQ